MTAYIIVNKETRELFEVNGEWIHKTLGKAKKLIKSHIEQKNKKRTTNKKLVWEDFEVLECELVVKVAHKL